MGNEELIRKLIQGSIQRAVQETVAAVLVLVGFAIWLLYSPAGSPEFFGCLLIMVGTGLIAGVVWSYALNDRLLQSHAAHDVDFWSSAFRAQARLLWLAPLWYAAPICVGLLLLVSPTLRDEPVTFFVSVVVVVAVFVLTTVLNRGAARRIEEMETQLRRTDSQTVCAP